MKQLNQLIGPQLYGQPKKESKMVSVNISFEYLRRPFAVLNFTGFAWVDQKYRFARNILEERGGLTIIHDSDYVAMKHLRDMLRDKNHEVVFVLSPSEDYRKKDHPFGKGNASNQRIRKAYDLLKEHGVKVKKFKSLDALTNYLIKKQSKYKQAA